MDDPLPAPYSPRGGAPLTIQAIPTRYAGCYFRSRLEARWAVFFDELRIPWQYEPEGYELSNGNQYLPDFLLPECATWIEVKGSDKQLNPELMRRAVIDLPKLDYVREAGPRLMILGPIPEPLHDGDWGWVGGDYQPCDSDGCSDCEQQDLFTQRWGFGNYVKNRRPWFLMNVSGTAPMTVPILDPYECGVPKAYAAARGARFEHGDREVW